MKQSSLLMGAATQRALGQAKDAASERSGAAGASDWVSAGALSKRLKKPGAARRSWRWQRLLHDLRGVWKVVSGRVV